MKRAIFILAAMAMLLAGCNKPPVDVVIITPEQADAPSLPALVIETPPPAPPLTVTGIVEEVDINGDTLWIRITHSGSALDITVDGDASAVGDIYDLDSSSIITVTVDKWAQNDTGYQGIARSISVDNQYIIDSRN